MVQDVMRETCLTDLAGIWYNLVATYSESSPDLAEAVLAAVKRYVSWIDISLVANDRCPPRCSAPCLKSSSDEMELLSIHA